MATVTMLQLRKHADQILRQVQGGQSLVLTYRGKPVARLEPIAEETARSDDPFYTLYRMADAQGESLTNQEIDELVYES
jgi:prevent-host-death family protein